MSSVYAVKCCRSDDETLNIQIKRGAWNFTTTSDNRGDPKTDLPRCTLLLASSGTSISQCLFRVVFSSLQTVYHVCITSTAHEQSSGAGHDRKYSGDSHDHVATIVRTTKLGSSSHSDYRHNPL